MSIPKTASRIVDAIWDTIRADADLKETLQSKMDFISNARGAMIDAIEPQQLGGYPGIDVFPFDGKGEPHSKCGLKLTLGIRIRIWTSTWNPRESMDLAIAVLKAIFTQPDPAQPTLTRIDALGYRTQTEVSLRWYRRAEPSETAEDDAPEHTPRDTALEILIPVEMSLTRKP